MGNKLIVGVHSDADVESYKRLPYMSHSERCREVRLSKYVDEIVENAELCITKELIERHNIHVVICSDEYYDKPNDAYYAYPRSIGILRKINYHGGISTSDLIKRVTSRVAKE